MADEMNTDERDALTAYLKDCDDHAITPDVGGTFHYAFMAGRASLAASSGSDGVASLSAAEPAIPASQPEVLDPRRIRKFLQALQAGEMSVSRAVEILDAWVGGYYEDDMVPPPPSDSCLIADDEFPMEIVRKLRAELEAPTLTQGAAIAAGAVNKISMPDVDDPGKVLLRTTQGWDFCRNGNMIRSLDEFEIGFVEAALRASHGQAPAGSDNDQRELLEDAAFLLRKYRRLCIEIGRGDSLHLDRIEVAALAVRALYASPQAAQQAHPIAPDVAADLERSDWTPEEALRWYAAGRHYDTVPNGDGTSSARILDNGAVASNALKALSRDYAEHKGDVALQEAAQQAPDPGPQSVTVEEAARHVGKWLNERPNRPLDLRDVAMLAAHAQQAPAGATSVPRGLTAVLIPATAVEKLFARKPRDITLYNSGSVEPYIDIDGSDLWCSASDFPRERFWSIDWMVEAAQAMQRATLAAPAAPSTPASFQSRVQPWLLQCFGAEIAADRVERNHRFLEESLELVQALGCTASEAHQLVDYVYGRPWGEPDQEVGGVMVTLAALCLASGLDMHGAGETELARIWTKVEKIRAKQAAKPKHSPLPASPTIEGESNV